MIKTTRQRVLEIDSLIDDYKRTKNPNSFSRLMEYFDPLIKKFLKILHPFKKIEPISGEVRAFTQLFSRYETLDSINKIKGLFYNYSEEELYNDLLLILANLIDKYKIVYKKEDGNRINFLRYIHMKYGFSVRDMVLKLNKDALSHSTGELFDHNTHVSKYSIFIPLDIDIDWVADPGESSIFKDFTHLDRYILYLRYEKGYSWQRLGKFLGMSSKLIKLKHDKMKEELVIKLQNY